MLRVAGIAVPIMTKGAAVTPSDSNTSGNVFYGGLWVGSNGTLAIDPLDSATGSVTLLAVTPGYYPFAVKRVLSTGTTVSGIIGFN
jgi:streptogramin lyase